MQCIVTPVIRTQVRDTIAYLATFAFLVPDLADDCNDVAVACHQVAVFVADTCHHVAVPVALVAVVCHLVHPHPGGYNIHQHDNNTILYKQSQPNM